MLSPASPPGPALGPALREGLKPGPGPSPTFKARARPGLVFLGPDPSLVMDYIHTSGRNPFHLNNEGDMNLGGHGPDHLLSL